jgi:CubicO group peptidase (beta-lactamase class C family)
VLANGGELEGRRYLAPEVVEAARTPLTQGPDRVLLIETAFSAGYMKDPVDAEGVKLRRLFGPSPAAFGQPGAGGSHAFADPENGLSFAYVMNQMEPGVLPNAKALSLVEALYG